MCAVKINKITLIKLNILLRASTSAGDQDLLITKI